MPTNIASPACDKDALCMVMTLEILFFSRLRSTLSGSEVTTACKLDEVPFTILCVGARVGGKPRFGTRFNGGPFQLHNRLTPPEFHA